MEANREEVGVKVSNHHPESLSQLNHLKQQANQEGAD
jgi:hypothetical protein